MYKIVRGGLFCFLAVALVVVPNLHAAAASSVSMMDWDNLNNKREFNPSNSTPQIRIEQGLSITIGHSKNGLILEYLNKKSQNISVEIPKEVVQVFNVRVSSNKIAVLGWMNNALASDVIILDISSGAILDEFWAYEPTPSPNGSIIAFIRFYPSHFVEGVENQYRFYDLNLSPGKNRPLRDKFSTAEDVVQDRSKTYVGSPLYQLNSVEVNRANTDVPNQKAHLLQSRFFWSDDSKRVAFVDQNEGVFAVIVSNFRSPGLPIISTVAPVPEMADVCFDAPIKPGCASYDSNLTRIEYLGEVVSVRLNANFDRIPERKINLKASRFKELAF